MPHQLTDLVLALRTNQLLLTDYCSLLQKAFAEREPSLLAFLSEENRFDRLRQEAEALYQRFPEPTQRPSLFGVPIGVKDIFHVAGFTTRAGSKLPPEELQSAEAASVTRLKKAGALILGKTVTTEFAYFGPGPTHNPHNPEHTPGGSSSGSAAAVGAGLCQLALGTQTIGSVVRPASFCGVVGYKPTYERISRAGVIPLSPSLDHIGTFTPDVAGARLAASALIEDWRVESGELRRPTLGIPTGPYLERASEAMLAHFENVCRKLAEAGYTIQRVPVMPDFAAIRERHYLITAADAARVHANWFPRHRALYHPKTIELLERGVTISEDALQAALAELDQLRAELTQRMQTHQIDLWITPAAPGPAPRGLDSTGDPVMNLPWTQVGFPALNLPSGKDAAGLPLGLQVVGEWGADEQMLKWAEEMESVLK